MKSKLQLGLKGRSPGTELRRGHSVVKTGGEQKERVAAAQVGILGVAVGFVVMRDKNKISNADETGSEILGIPQDDKVHRAIGGPSFSLLTIKAHLDIF